MLNVSANFVAARVGRLATCGAQGQPHCVPVCFVWFEGRAVIALDEKPKRVDVLRLKRVRNVLENPLVSLVVDHYEEDWAKLSFVMLEGRAELRELKFDELQALRSKYPQYQAMKLHWGLVVQPERWVTWSAS
jgi:coenzyme F420-0:L-glutamate ligase/coenzyme F420-1:gamma-L-glutamate ligase